MIVPSQKLQQLHYLENIYFYSSKLSNNNVFFFIAPIHCCLKASQNRNKCFLNNKVAVVFGLVQSYLIHIAYIYIYISINIYKKYGTYFPQIVSILSYIRYILCSELIPHCREILNVTLGVPNATEGSFFWWRRERFVWPQTSRQFMKLNSCICLT